MSKTVKNALPEINATQQSDLDFIAGIREKIANRFFKGNFEVDENLRALLQRLHETVYWAELVARFTKRIDKKALIKAKKA